MPDLDRDAFSRQSELLFPRQIRSWLPFLWSRVLFSGRKSCGGPVRYGALLLLLLLPSALLYPGMAIPLFEPDEGRYAEIPREMLLRGEWVVPYLQGEPYLDKPPLLYWLVGLSYRLFGIHDWSARLVPALAVHACILLTYGFGRRILGERAAFWGALLLSLAPGFISIGRLLILDGLLTLWVTLAVLAAYKAVRDHRLRYGWWLLAAIACGLGILAKGPVAVLLSLPPLWAYRKLQGKPCRIGWQALLAFAVTMLIVALPWYIAICLRLPAFASYFFWQHNIMRFLVPFDHLRPIWFYGPVLLVGLLPATLFVVPFVRFLFSADPAVSERRCPELGYLLLCGGWCLVFFSLSGCKLPTYVLPAFPCLALALGYYLVTSGWTQSRWPKVIAQLSVAVLFVGHNLVLPWYAGYRAATAHLAELKTYCGDKGTPVVCYPRNCDSAAFYIGRDDLQSYRSKQTHLLVRYLQDQPRTVLLLTHRHSLQGLRYALTPDLRVVDVRHFGLGAIPGLPEKLTQKLTWFMGETSLGLCDIAVVERRPSRGGSQTRTGLQPPKQARIIN
jgi:Dolichyl-phosphate-mannose-protein mannosyltransferase